MPQSVYLPGYRLQKKKREILNSNPAEGIGFSVRHRLQTEYGVPPSLLSIWYKK